MKSSVQCTSASSFAKIRRQSSPSFGRVWESINHILRVRGHAILEEHSAAAVYDAVFGSGLSNGSSRVSRRTAWHKKPLSAGLSRIGFMRARVIAAPAHLGAFIAAKPRILDMIPDAAREGAFSSWRRVSLRSSRPPPPPVSALSTTVSKQRRSCMFRRQLRQQTKPGCKLSRDRRDHAPQTRTLHPWSSPAPPLKSRTAMTWTSRRPGRAVSVGRSSKRSFHDSLIGLFSGV